MSKRIYEIHQVKDGSFELYENNELLCRFKHETFREDLSLLGRGQRWIGSILRLYLKKYPRSYSCPIQNRSPLERIGAQRLVEYFRSKGVNVFKDLGISDREGVEYLESLGYRFDGVIYGQYYRSPAFIVEELLSDASREAEPARDAGASERRDA